MPYWLQRVEMTRVLFFQRLPVTANFQAKISCERFLMRTLLKVWLIIENAMKVMLFRYKGNKKTNII